MKLGESDVRLNRESNLQEPPHGAHGEQCGASDAPLRLAVVPSNTSIADTLEGKRVLLWGYGMEGRCAEAFIKAHCAVQSLDVYSGLQDGIDEDSYDVIIKSPGIREEHWNERYTSVTQLFMQQFSGQTIGVTGTKGKSTTVSLLYQVLKSCQDRPVLLVGNIGVPCLDEYDAIDPDTIVVFELSCHQLDHLTVSPHIAVFLNLYEEHLDHYDTLERYFAAKENIALHQGPDDIFYVGEQVPAIQTQAQTHIIPSASASDGVAPFSMQLEGAHNQYNARVVCEIATKLFGCDEAKVREVIAAFTGLPHRLQRVGTVDGVDYYDDSISTIPEATIAALQSIPRAQTVLVGGMDRGIAYDKLVSFVRTNQNYTYIFMYATGKRIFEQVADLPCCRYVEDLAAAVALARELTPAGTACILSPAAASYGYFKNFEERGDVFRALVVGGGEHA